MESIIIVSDGLGNGALGVLHQVPVIDEEGRRVFFGQALDFFNVKVIGRRHRGWRQDRDVRVFSKLLEEPFKLQANLLANSVGDSVDVGARPGGSRASPVSPDADDFIVCKAQYIAVQARGADGRRATRARGGTEAMSYLRQAVFTAWCLGRGIIIGLYGSIKKGRHVVWVCRWWGGGGGKKRGGWWWWMVLLTRRYSKWLPRGLLLPRPQR